MHDRIFVWAQKDIYLKIKFYQVLPILWCGVATHFASRTIGSVSWLVLVGDKSRRRSYCTYSIKQGNQVGLT
jgi:hypothetical protein